MPTIALLPISSREERKLLWSSNEFKSNKSLVMAHYAAFLESMNPSVKFTCIFDVVYIRFKIAGVFRIS